MIKQKHLEVTPETHNAVKKAAIMNDMTIKEFVTFLIKQYNKKDKK